MTDNPIRQFSTLLLLVAALLAPVLLEGCSNRATTSSEAIQHAKTLGTPSHQEEYLIVQARAFFNAKNYQEAMTTAQYVLASVDGRSQDAQSVLEQVKRQLAKDTEAVVGEAKASVGL